MNVKNRITFYGPKGDGTSVVEFIMAGGEALAIAIPRGEAVVIKQFQERMPSGLFVPEVPSEDQLPFATGQPHLHSPLSD